MNDLREFIDALFPSETPAQKKERGWNYLILAEDEDCKKLSKGDGEAASMFFQKYINKSKVKYKGHLAEPNRHIKKYAICFS